MQHIDGVRAAALHPEQIQLEEEVLVAVFGQHFKDGLAGLLQTLELIGMVVIHELHALFGELCADGAGFLRKAHDALGRPVFAGHAHAQIAAADGLHVPDERVEIIAHALIGGVNGRAFHAGFVQQGAQLGGGDVAALAGHLADVIAHRLEPLQAGEHILFVLAVIAHGIDLKAELELCHGLFPPFVLHPIRSGRPAS